MTNSEKNKRIHPAERLKPDAAVPETKPKKTVIPKFDLGKKILTTQRRAASTKRTGPGAKGVRSITDSPAIVPLLENMTVRPRQKPPLPDTIIKDIVAKDIERFRRKSK